MSAGPIKRERLATTAPPIPRIRKGDDVTITSPSGAVDPTVWHVIECDGVIATLQLPSGSKMRRYCRDLTKVKP